MWKRGRFLSAHLKKLFYNFIALLTRPNIKLAVCVIVRYFHLARGTTIGYGYIFILNWLANINSLIPFGHYTEGLNSTIEWHEARKEERIKKPVYFQTITLDWNKQKKTEGKGRRNGIIKRRVEYLNAGVNSIHGHFHNLDAIFRFMCGWHVLFEFWPRECITRGDY